MKHKIIEISFSLKINLKAPTKVLPFLSFLPLINRAWSPGLELSKQESSKGIATCVPSMSCRPVISAFHKALPLSEFFLGPTDSF